MRKKKPFDLTFEKNDFITRIAKLNGEIIGRNSLINEKGKIDDNPEYVENAKDEYITSVTQSAINIIFTYEQLEFIPVFMRRFPDKKFYNDYGINHPKYLQYHIENHFLKVATILDQCVRLTSDIYNLGISPKLSSLNQLTENKHTKKTKSVEILKKLNKEIQEIKTIRNKISHRGEFNDSEIDRVSKFYFISSVSEEGEITKYSERTLKFHMKEVVKNRTELVISNTEKLKSYISKLFEESLIEFELQFERLKK